MAQALLTEYTIDISPTKLDQFMKSHAGISEFLHLHALVEAAIVIDSRTYT
jgi:hypothetical protein